MAATSTATGATLLSIPLELRHAIYDHAADREKNAKVVLRHWFERKDMKGKINQQLASNPNAVVPRMLYNDEVDDPIQEDSSDDEENEEDEQDEDEEEEDGDDANDDEEQGEIEEEDLDIDEAEGLEDGDTELVDSPAFAPPGPVIRADRKWRHVNKFIGITQCPPPVELLTTCKQLMREAMDWYYDVAVLRIFATASFAHTDMFEECLDQMVDAAFSPVENVRKVEIVFIWDTAWLSTSDLVAVFPAMLCERVDYITKVLQRAPGLKQMKVVWHDSLTADQSTNEETVMWRLDILQGFYDLFPNLELEEHYLKPGEEPYAKSIMGKRRLEFKAIETACKNGSWNMF